METQAKKRRLLYWYFMPTVAAKQYFAMQKENERAPFAQWWGEDCA